MEEIGEDKKPLLADGNQEDNLFNQPSNQKKLSKKLGNLSWSLIVRALSKWRLFCDLYCWSEVGLVGSSAGRGNMSSNMWR